MDGFEDVAAVEAPGDFARLIWRGRWHVNRLTRGDSATARRLFDRAVALEVAPNVEALKMALKGIDVYESSANATCCGTPSSGSRSSAAAR